MEILGQRIRLSRESCRFTQKTLSEKSGVPVHTIAGIESGKNASTEDANIERIAKATGFPLMFFYKGDIPDLPEGKFRKKKRGKAFEERQILAYVEQTTAFVEYAQTKVKLPTLTFDCLIDSSQKDATYDEIEAIAQDVRDRIGVDSYSPINNLTKSLERSGVIVAALPIPFNDFDGYSVWPEFGYDASRPLITTMAGAPGDRHRASLAHETGHLVFHTLRRSINPDKAEDEAWAFAGALLMPKESLGEDIGNARPTMATLRSLKTKYGVSLAFAARRLKNSGMITEDHYASLMKQLSARGWRKCEPGKVGVESPSLLPKIMKLLKDDPEVLMQYSLYNYLMNPKKTLPNGIYLVSGGVGA